MSEVKFIIINGDNYIPVFYNENFGYALVLPERLDVQAGLEVRMMNDKGFWVKCGYSDITDYLFSVIPQMEVKNDLALE